MVELTLLVPLALGLVLLRAMPTVEPHQRALLERLGRFHRVLEPGMHLVVPFVDRVRIIDLDAAMPGWKRISEREIQARLVESHYRSIPRIEP
ncbi:MAG: SPFH domain-containing protein [Gammaproteobacteria bacterium]